MRIAEWAYAFVDIRAQGGVVVVTGHGMGRQEVGCAIELPLRIGRWLSLGS